eukprot:Opistho-2@10987
MASAGVSAADAGIPVLVVVGATGTGKSKLAIELALDVGGEIINADAMQMYEGLDIATNKVTEEESCGVPHHLLGFADRSCEVIVGDYCRLAVEKIRDIHQRGRVPILVGGTNYYIEAVIWNNTLVASPDAIKGENDEDRIDVIPGKYQNSNELASVSAAAFASSVRLELDALDTPRLYTMLCDVDPDMSNRIHPNDRRKIVRSLEVHRTHGISHSALLAARQHSGGALSCGETLRFPRSLFLWVECDLGVLDPRLDRRVDGMLSRGLIEELSDHANALVRAKRDEDLSATTTATTMAVSTWPDFTRGSLQTIGFKEFHSFVFAMPVDDDDGEQTTDRAAREAGVEATKAATRRYARKQIAWIRKKLCARIAREHQRTHGEEGSTREEPGELDASCVLAGNLRHVACPIFRRLNASDLSLWNANVRDIAVQTVRAFLSSCSSSPMLPGASSSLLSPPSQDDSIVSLLCDESHLIASGALSFTAAASSVDPSPDRLTRRVCERCDGKIIMGEKEWNDHQRSKGHRRRGSRKRAGDWPAGGTGKRRATSTCADGETCGDQTVE